MKQSNRKNAVLGLLALVLLAAGGIAVYFGMHSDKVVHAGEEVIWADGTMLYFKDQADDTEMREAASTGSGIFFKGTDFDPVLGWQDSHEAIKYYDNESGETVYLCARPNCLHNGDEFCPASTENYMINSNLVWYDGYLYAAAVDKSEQLSQSNAKDATVLLRYAADGTEITRVADLHTSQRDGYDDYYSWTQITVHRGQFWIDCAYSLSYPQNDKLDLEKKGNYRGYDMLVYSPDTGNVSRLYGTDEPIKNMKWSGCKDYKGVEDYIYFRKDDEFKNPFKGLGLFRIDCRTGQTEHLVSGNISTEIPYYAVLDDKLFYWMEYKQPNNYMKYTLHLYDLNTNEDTVISTYDTTKSKTYNELKAEGIFFVDAMFATEDSVVLLHTGVMNPEDDWEDWVQAIYADVLDRDGNLIQSAVCDQQINITDEHIIEGLKAQYGNNFESEEEMEEQHLFDDTPIFLHDIAYTDGKVYIPGCSIMMYAAQMSDIMTGKFILTPAYAPMNYIS